MAHTTTDSTLRFHTVNEASSPNFVKKSALQKASKLTPSQPDSFECKATPRQGVKEGSSHIVTPQATDKTPLLLTGLALLTSTGALVCGAILLFRKGEKMPDTPAAFNQQIAELKAALKSVNPPDLSEITSKLDTLQQQITQIETNKPVSVEDLEAKLETLKNTILADFNQQITNLKADLNTTNPPDLSEITSKLDMLQQQITQLETHKPVPAEDLEAKLETLKNTILADFNQQIINLKADLNTTNPLDLSEITSKSDTLQQQIARLETYKPVPAVEGVTLLELPTTTSSVSTMEEKVLEPVVNSSITPPAPVWAQKLTTSERLGISPEQRKQQKAEALQVIEKLRSDRNLPDLSFHTYTDAEIPSMGVGTKIPGKKDSGYIHYDLNKGIKELSTEVFNIPEKFRVKRAHYSNTRDNNSPEPISIIDLCNFMNAGFHIERTLEETPRFHMTIKVHDRYISGSRPYIANFYLSNENPTVMKDLLRLLLVDNLGNFSDYEKATNLRLRWKNENPTCMQDVFLTSLQFALKDSVEALRNNPQYAQLSAKYPDNHQFLDALWPQLLPEKSPIKTWLSKNNFSIDEAFENIKSGDLRRVITPSSTDNSSNFCQDYLE
jgi:polyhydroxyalkanoate synthesis regulator phasin